MLNPALFATGEDPAIWLVVLMGVGVVFLGLICIIGICYLMGLIVNGLFGKKKEAQSAPTPTPTVVSGGAIENRQQILAAVCAAVAEEEGTDISAIRVISFKKV